MGKRERRTFMEEFKREAVHLTETIGRTIAQVADDLGIGLSTLIPPYAGGGSFVMLCRAAPVSGGNPMPYFL
jgi:hypothetical protein